MKLVHSTITEEKQADKKKVLPMHKNPVLLAEMEQWLITNHNKKFKAKKS